MAFRLISRSDGAQWKLPPIIHDLSKPLPFSQDTFSAIYASHVLEHLYFTDAQKLLAECRRVLKPGGVIRLVVPDLRALVREYLDSSSDNRSPANGSCAADRLNERLGFRQPAPSSGNLLLRFYRISKDFHSHKWMYDATSLARCLERAGFAQVSEKEFQQSDIPGIEEVENPERVLGGAGICIEGKKVG